MSTHLIIVCFVLVFFSIGFSFMFNEGFEQKTKSSKVIGIVASIIIFCAYFFLAFREYRDEKWAENIVSNLRPIEYIEGDTIKLYEVDGRYYRYAPRMNQLVYYYYIWRRMN